MFNKIIVKVNVKDECIEVKKGIFGATTIYSGGWYENHSIEEIIEDFKRSL